MTPKTSKPRPWGSLTVGRRDDGNRASLSKKERTTHMAVVGAIGSGKTVFLEHLIRQDLRHGRGVAVLDPQGALHDRLVSYCAYRRRDALLLDLSSEWITGLDIFRRGSDDLAAFVERRIQIVMKSWGSRGGDETPRLEKWLRCLFTLVAYYDLSILEGYLILQDAALRAHLLAGIPSRMIRGLFTDLSSSSFREYQNQIESTVNRLLRFGEDSTVGLSLGLKERSLDIEQLMANRGVLLVKVPLCSRLSEIQQKTVGTLLVNEFYEAAMRRDSGKVHPPFHLYIDEAGMFTPPELAYSLDFCRQKGLRVTFAFQHLSQFEDPRIRKSITNSARTKVVFNVPDPRDAGELADLLFTGLADPKVKHITKNLSYRLKDTYRPTFGLSFSNTTSIQSTTGTADTSSMNATRGESVGEGGQVGDATHSDAAGSHTVQSSGVSWQSSRNRSLGFGLSHAETRQKTVGTAATLGLSIGLVPVTLHEPFMEEKSRQFFTLEENRYRAAEIIRKLPVGRCVVQTPSGETGQVTIPLPMKTFTKPEDVVAFSQRLFGICAVPREEASRLVRERQLRLLASADKAKPERPPRRSPRPKR